MKARLDCEELSMNDTVAISVIMPVYNAEKYLKEAIESVLNQTYQDFELIIVDDASTDSSLEICKQTCHGRKNVKIIHCEQNGGLPIARNNGLIYSTGKYISFIDSDDAYNPAALEIMYTEAEKSQAEVISSIGYIKGDNPARFISGLKHPAFLPDDIESRINFFCQGKVPFEVHIKMFSRDFLAKYNLLFDNIDLMEDVLFTFYAMCLSKKFLFIPQIFYLYRMTPESISRGHKNDASQFGKIAKTLVTASKYIDNFFHRFAYFSEHKDLAMKAKTFIIGHVMEYYLSSMGMYENPVYMVDRSIPLQLSEAALKSMSNITDKDSAWLITFLINEIIRYHTDTGRKSIYTQISSENIQRKQTEYQVNILVYYEFLTIENDCMNLEGFAFISGLETDNVHFYLRINDAIDTKCEITSRENINRDYVGKNFGNPWNFKASIKNISQYESVKCSLFVKIGNTMVELRGGRLSPFFPVSNDFREAYAMFDGWMARFFDGHLVLLKSTPEKQKKQEERFLAELASLNNPAAQEAIVLRKKYHDIKPTLKKEVWLISDRPFKAGDNGEVLFRYLSGHKCAADCYYILQEDSPDFIRLSQYREVVPYLSPSHKLLHLLAHKLISSQADPFVYNPFSKDMEFYRDIMCKKKQIFLLHGIIQGNLSGWLNRHNKNLALFLTNTPKEHMYILKNDYHYDEKVVKLTGMPRYDNLIAGKEENIITIMPTWRIYLVDNKKSDYIDGRYTYNDSFTKSQFFQFYNNLLNDERLLNGATKYGYRIQVMLHPNLHPAKHFFSSNPKVYFHPFNTPYHEIFQNSKMIVTDYSSVAFDFAYMRKPIVYCHFDCDTVMKKHIYSPGKSFFDYERDGFGEVKYNLDETVDCLIEYMKNDCQIKEIYRKRIDSFFVYHDKNNCQRVYEAIMAMD